MCEVVYCPRCGAEMSAVFKRGCLYCEEVDKAWDEVVKDLKKEGEAMKPIIFSAESVRAILQGRKTQTRRVVKPQPLDVPWCTDSVNGDHFYDKAKGSSVWLLPPYQPGDILWVREAWAIYDLFANPEYLTNNTEGAWFWNKKFEPSMVKNVVYKADFNEGKFKGAWRPSIHMPRAAARIFLRVSDVSVERLHEMDEQDATGEGMIGPPPGIHWHDGMELSPIMCALDDYAALWDILYAKRGYPWDSNPWV